MNLSALSPTLIESDLFGHAKGAFTGATADRAGWLEQCKPLGTVFLDEIGELDPAIQVKLLRVVQTRSFTRLGRNASSGSSTGKIIAATNRDLADEMHAGRFREDLYYRLCSDLITTTPLREQLADAPEDLHTLVLFAAERIAGDDAEQLAAKWRPGSKRIWVATMRGRATSANWSNACEIASFAASTIRREHSCVAQTQSRAWLDRGRARHTHGRRAAQPLLPLDLRQGRHLRRHRRTHRPRSPHGEAEN